MSRRDWLRDTDTSIDLTEHTGTNESESSITLRCASGAEPARDATGAARTPLPLSHRRATMPRSGLMRRCGFTPASWRLATAPIAFLMLLGLPAPASGHGARLPFASWGGFSPGAVLCQRVIARSAAHCASAAWTAQRACEAAKLAGQTCDQNATDTIVEAIRNNDLNAIDIYCSERQLIELQYLGQFDMQADVVKFCRDWQRWATNTVYGPAEAASNVSAAQRACVEATADAVDALTQFAFRNRRQCMDHVASVPLNTPNRTALLNGAANRMTQAQPTLRARLTARCGAAPFAALYGRTPDALITTVAGQADCIGGRFYIQDAVVCPNPVCGNGIVELGEDCDDGNTNDGDTCPSTCTLP
jgi:cysteine-rich repeat protein